MEYLERIDAMGGTLRAIETGFIQNEIQNAAFEYQQAVESGEQVVVGVNRFRRRNGIAIPTFRLDPALEKAQVERLREVRASRDARRRGALGRLEQAARGSENLMPLILDAAAGVRHGRRDFRPAAQRVRRVPRSGLRRRPARSAAPGAERRIGVGG